MRCCLATRSASQRSASSSPLSCSPGGASSSISVRVCSGGVGQHLLGFDQQLQLVAIVDAALDLGELHRHAGEILRGAIVQFARELAARAFFGQRDLRGQRAQLRIVLRERVFGFAHRRDIAAAAPEAQHVAVFDDADHRDQQHAIEAVRPVHHVLDVAHLVAVADGFADALDIDRATRSG